MYAPAHDDEITTTVAYIDQQLSAIRASVYGLTEEQARSTPTRSALSLATIVKHLVHGMRGVVHRLAIAPELPSLDEQAYADYMGAFTIGADETTVGLLEQFDAARADYLAALRAVDPGSELMEPPAPWHGIFQPQPSTARYYLTHQVEEMARHAGHADIIREQIDGMPVPALVLTLEGAGPNDFFQPFEPAPGTIGA